jgi:ABC-2 type transport system ATP-binding protein
MLKVNNVHKKYSTQYAVNNISFEVATGKIFGLLGPNGAGKSSLLRMVTGITAPDSGTITLDDKPFRLEEAGVQIGYMPEERGMYKKMKVYDQALYIAQLKGLSKSEAATQIQHWFDKLDMQTWANKKIEDLSKGMSQKLQFVITVVHRPKLLILDEPFSGLDPVNAEIIKKEIFELAKQGHAIIFSTHRMEQVEEICDEILLMNKGVQIAEGDVEQLKDEHKSGNYELITPNALASNEYFEIVSNSSNKYILKLNEGYTAQHLLANLVAQNIEVKSFKEIRPSLNDIFIKLVEGNAVTQFNK